MEVQCEHSACCHERSKNLLENEKQRLVEYINNYSVMEK